ncbi:DMT family transporter [Agrobacterium rhizogenes]|nr:DMT family transporter [Rhizobium rhizogenes]
MSRTTLGILLALVVYLFYTIGDAMVKSLGHRVSVFEIGLIEPFFALTPAILAIMAKRPRETWRETSRLVHPVQSNLIGVLRAVAATTGIFAYISIPLAEAYCIIFLTPVLVTVFSVITLKEKVTSDRWILMIVSFASVVLVVRPGFRELSLGHLTALGCAISSSAATVLTRKVATNERQFGLYLLPGLYTVGLNAVVLSFIGFAWPSAMDLFLLLFAGLLNGFAFLMFLAALRMAPASRIAPMQYSQMAWALMFGALFFNEVPDFIGLIGLTVLICAGISHVVADGARARIASRWAEYRARRDDDLV